jgi:hypothetical protein
MISSICPGPSLSALSPTSFLSFFISYYACLLLFGATVYALVGVWPLLITFLPSHLLFFSCVFRSVNLICVV